MNMINFHHNLISVKTLYL